MMTKPDLTQVVAEAIKSTKPAHYHVNSGNGTDTCRECGKDLRHECHLVGDRRIEEVTALLQTQAALESLTPYIDEVREGLEFIAKEGKFASMPLHEQIERSNRIINYAKQTLTNPLFTWGKDGDDANNNSR